MKFKLPFPLTKGRVILWSLASLILVGSLFHDYVINVACHCPSNVGFKTATSDPRFQAELSRHANYLATDLGQRNLFFPDKLKSTENYIFDHWKSLGYAPKRQTYSVGKIPVSNVIIEIKGTKTPEEIIVVGAHYDSAKGSPGADDNATGVAAMLVLSEEFKAKQLGKTVRFVAFVNAEPPFLNTEHMGSRVYASEIARRKDKLLVMLSLDSMGFYSDAKGSQKYPMLMSWVYPKHADYLAFVGNLPSRGIVNVVTSLFRSYSDLPAECAKMGGKQFSDSDHASFWREGYPAIEVTDLGERRHPGFHTAGDTIDRVDFGKLDKAVQGLKKTLEALSEDKEFRPGVPG